MPLPPGFGIFSVNAGVAPCEAARRVVAPYGRHRPRKAGGHRGPPVPRCGTFSRPPAGFWNGLVRRAPTRTPCHGWSEPGAVVKWRRPEICAASGPGGPGGIIPGTIFCAPELLRRGIGVSPVNGGRGVERLWAGTPIGAHPRRSFCFFPIAGKETRPAGRNPVRRRAESSRPTGVTVRGGWAGQETRPYGVSGRSQQNRTVGGASPSPTGWMGRHSSAENQRTATWGRPLRRIPPARQIIQGNTVKISDSDQSRQLRLPFTTFIILIGSASNLHLLRSSCLR